MAKSVKASKFTKANITKGAQRQMTKRVKNGVPVKSDPIGNKILDGFSALVKVDSLPSENLSNPTDVGMSIIALAALGITIEVEEPNKPPMSFLEYTMPAVNEADKKNKMRDKNYGDDIFPERDNPIYELDESPPDFIQKSNKKPKAKQGDGRIIRDIFYEITIVNTSSKLPNSQKLKQFAENG